MNRSGDVTDWPCEELWRKSLKLQQGNLRALEAAGYSSVKAIAEARRRVERIWDAGRPEWHEAARPSRIP